ncbi:MFS transporter [Plastoroseomonas hellenica]|uniref:MFS transporter n=1 Tax=Plastoroseomonas hellenica TaxID=2687306 RepID=UPI001BAB3EFB|nr:MFS transporter [Plastoroseomonas hellenica]MBR0645008.1 MFS transporter [Plastoroseomonas hellenica]
MLPLWVSALSATLLVQTISSFAAGVIPLLGPILMARASLSPEGIGYVSALITLGNCWYLAGGGPMLAHFGPVRSLQIGLAFVALGLLVLSQPIGVAALIGAIAVGIGLGPNTSAGSQMLLRTAPPRHRTLVFSIKQAGVPLGGACAGIAVAPLVTSLGFPAAIWIVVAAALLGILLAQPFRRPLDEESAGTRLNWLRSLFSAAALLRSGAVLRSHPSLPMLTMLGMSLSITQACITAFTATYMITRHSASLAEAGLYIAVMQAASVTGRIALGWMADRMGRGLRHLGVQAVLSAGAVGLLVATADQGPWAAFACVALIGFTALGWNGIYYAELAGMAPPRLVADVSSAATLVAFIGSIGGPLVFALIVGATGNFAIGFLAAAAQLVVFGLVAWRHAAQQGSG